MLKTAAKFELAIVREGHVQREHPNVSQHTRTVELHHPPGGAGGKKSPEFVFVHGFCDNRTEQVYYAQGK